MKHSFLTLALFGVLVGCQSSEMRAYETAAAELPAAEAAAKAAGVGTNPKALYPTPPVAAEENAGPLIRKATQQLARLARSNPSASRDIEVLVGQSGSSAIKQSAERLALVKAALETASQAAQRPRLDFYRNWDAEDPWSISFPELAEVKNIVKLLSLRGTHLAQTGDTAGSIRDFKSAFQLSNLVGTEPTLIAALVQIATTSIVVRQIEYSITARPRDSRYLASLRSLVLAQPESMNFQRYMTSESISGFKMAKNIGKLKDGLLEQYSSDDSPSMKARVRAIFPDGVSSELLAKAYKTRSLQVWTRVANETKDISDPIQASEKVDAILKAIEQSKDPSERLNQLMFPVFTHAGAAMANRTAVLRTVKGLLDVMIYRDRIGRYPASLAQAGFKGIDPFDGKPIRYLVEGNEVRVYSVYSDRQDDSGLANRPELGTTGVNRRDTASLYPRTSRPAIKMASPQAARIGGPPRTE